MRIVRAPTEDLASEIAAYRNRHGVTYYLHEVLGRDGIHRYVARQTLRDGALTRMPDGYTFTESLGGRVGVKRMHGPGSKIPHSDLEMVRKLLSWHPHLCGYIAERCTNDITIHEPDPEPHPDEAEARRRGFTLANRFANYPHVRLRMQFQLRAPEVWSDLRIYELHEPLTPGDYRTQHIDTGPLKRLAVRHLLLLPACTPKR